MTEYSQEGPFNLLVWRRSALFILLFASLYAALLSTVEVLDTNQKARYTKELSQAPLHRNIREGYLTENTREVFNDKYKRTIWKHLKKKNEESWDRIFIIFRFVLNSCYCLLLGGLISIGIWKILLNGLYTLELSN